MKNIRSQIFETNSSSSHSITIADSGGLLDTIYPDENGVITLTGGEWSWEVEDYNDAQTKANYCAVDISYQFSEERCDLSLEDLLIEVIKEHTGAKEVRIKIDEDSYIDHQSVGTSLDAFVDKETLKTFLFNPESTLHTDNDNH
jgi:hypothetical protein